MPSLGLRGAGMSSTAWWWPPQTRRTLPGKATWYLATNLPRPGCRREAASDNLPGALAEVTRIYGIRRLEGIAKPQAGQK